MEDGAMIAPFCPEISPEGQSAFNSRALRLCIENEYAASAWVKKIHWLFSEGTYTTNDVSFSSSKGLGYVIQP